MKDDIKKRLLSIAYIAVVFFSVHYFSLYFIFANYLNQYFDKSTLSIIFALGAAMSIVASHFFGKVLRKYTNERSLRTVLIIQFIVTTFLALSNILNIYIIAILCILQSALFTLIWVSINVFISEFSDHENTGAIRGTILSIYNFGAITAPFLTAQVFNFLGYSSLFIISALAILPLMYLNKRFFRDVKEPKYKRFGLRESFITVFKDKDMRGIISSSFFINCFFTAINVYLVLYLTENIGIPIVLYLELILPISMIPFIIVPYNLGKYSDEIFGEKKAMMFGILMMSSVLISIYAFDIKTTNIFVWMALIFIARLGATTTETENYAYFYRKIDSRNAGLIALFQNMSNISFIFITVLGAILIKTFNINLTIIFLIVGIIGIISIFIIRNIKNTQIKKKKIESEKEIVRESVENEEEKIKEVENSIKKDFENKKVRIWA